MERLYQSNSDDCVLIKRDHPHLCAEMRDVSYWRAKMRGQSYRARKCAVALIARENVLSLFTARENEWPRAYRARMCAKVREFATSDVFQTNNNLVMTETGVNNIFL